MNLQYSTRHSWKKFTGDYRFNFDPVSRFAQLGLFDLLDYLLDTSSLMDAVTKARARLRLYPRLITECRQEGKIYASCVATREDIKQNDCVNEFQKFKNCLLKSAVKLGTKL